MLFSRKERKGRKELKESMMTDFDANMICDKLRQIAYDLHVYLGVGYFEKSVRKWFGAQIVQSRNEGAFFAAKRIIKP